MNSQKRIDKVYETAKRICFNDSSKLVLISDCHRGDGSGSDNFLKNQNIYCCALTQYYNNGFTYIELGDGDELWENKDFSDIRQVHSNIFWLLSNFYNDDRLYFLYGNHDYIKSNPEFIEENFHCFYDERKKRNVPLFKNIEIPEGMILCYKETNSEILLLHGHQGDFMNDTMRVFSAFLVRYFWKPLEIFGVNDPTSPAKNYIKREKVSARLERWAKHNNMMLIAGHTHKPVFPQPGEILYFNDGSCVHPRCITAIEITNGEITLVKWSVKTREDSVLFVGRDIIEGPVKLSEYFNTCSKKQKETPADT